MPTLLSQLNYTPKELQFGTSGRRGLIVDLTQLEIYVNVIADETVDLIYGPRTRASLRKSGWHTNNRKE